jgi:chromosome segregation ATPase
MIKITAVVAALTAAMSLPGCGMATMTAGAVLRIIDSRIAHLERRAEEAEKKNEELEAKVTKLEKSSTDKDRQLAALKLELDEVKDQVASMEKEVSDSKTEIANLDVEIEKLTQAQLTEGQSDEERAKAVQAKKAKRDELTIRMSTTSTVLGRIKSKIDKAANNISQQV